MAEQQPIVDFSLFDVNRPIAEKAEVERYIPQRFEMSQLDGVLYEAADPIVAVGFKDLTQNEFWVRGHMPEFALMPGVLMCESAAQLIAFLAGKHNFAGNGIMAFGGLDEVRFRHFVVPGDRLIVMVAIRKLRPNAMVVCDFQGFVDQKPVVHGVIRGIVLPREAMQGGEA